VAPPSLSISSIWRRPSEQMRSRAGAVLSHDTSKELRPDEIPLIRNARLLQFTAAGVDWVPTRDLPSELPVAANKGGGAEPMSEHIVALALAAAKRLFIEHANLQSGEFNQAVPTECCAAASAASSASAMSGSRRRG
jgi:phosphoglycerate dehydrogenase-like enzyme